MERNAIGFALLALFAIAVIGVASSSIHSTPIQSGFGIEDGSTDGDHHTPGISSKNSSNASRNIGESGGGGAGGSGGFDSQDSSGSSSGSIPPLVVVVALVGVAAVGVGLIVWATSNDELPADTVPAVTETTEVDDTHSEPTTSVEPTNVVYQAWWEMAQQTAISHTASRSPAEFETAAIDAGMNPEAVTELTHLFRMIRYGQSSVTDDAERRATAARDRLHHQSGTGGQEMDMDQ